MRPEVGMGCTIQMHSDRHAATIVGVSPSGKTVWVQRDNATRVDTNGISEIQEYTYSPNPNAAIQCFRLRNGSWKSHGLYLLIGIRREYFDYCF